MNKILIIEDEKKMAKMLKKAFEEEAFMVDVAFDGYVGVKVATEKNYDAIILDIGLSLLNGYEVCREIRKRNCDVPILMLSASGTMDNKLSCFNEGADDYITKPFEFKELLARVKVFIKRKGKDNGEKQIMKIANLEMDIYKKTVKRDGKKIMLTLKEYQLLEYLMKNMGRTVSRDELAENIWDMNFDSKTNTIDVWVYHLRKKMDKDFSPKLIHAVFTMGFVIKED